MSVISTLLVKLGVDADDIEKGIDKGSAAIESGAKKFAIAGAAAGGAVVAGIVGAMNVESANDKLSAQLGLSAKESERIGGVAGKLYAGAYGENLAEVNTAVGAVMSSIDGMATASSKSIEGLSAKALDFATTFEVDVQKAVSTVGVVLKSGLAKNATEAFDLVTAASQRVPAHLREDVLDAAEEYSQFFNTLGIGGKEAFALIVDAADKGVYGIDKIGDAVKEFTIRSTDMSVASRGAYEAVGLDAEKMANKILKGGKSARNGTQQVIDGLLSIKNPAKQAEAAIALFGTPIEDLNVKDIPDFLKSLQGGSDKMDGFKGAADRMGDTLNDNANTNLETFKRKITTTFVDFVGGKALPIVDDMASALAKDFGPAVSEVTDFLKKHEAIVKPVAVGLGAMAVVVGVIAGVTWAWAAAQTAANAALLLNPFVAIGVAIVGIGAALYYAYKRSETFRTIVSNVGVAVKLIFVSLAIIAVKSFRFLLNAALSTFSGILSAAEKGMGWIPGIGGKIKKAKEAFDSFKDKTISALDKTAAALERTRDKINGIKSPKPVKVGVEVTPAMLKLAGLQRKINGIVGKIVTLYVQVKSKNKGPYDPTLGGLIGSNAHGTSNWRGGLTGLHEQGPEIVDLPGGSRVYPAGITPPPMAGGGRTVIELRSSGSKVDDMLVALLRNAIQVRGGDVQVVLGR